MMSNRYCVIMSGGIGSRFWPMSREKKPKQFLDFFGTGNSLIQQTYNRFSRFIPKENIIIVTNADYAEQVLEQLPELSKEQILTEPTRRNTAPCIAYAAYHIAAKDENASMIIAPSDHLILKEDEFVLSAEKALTYVEKNEVLVTLGVEPSRPETGYGYIQKGDLYNADFIKVKTFTEKPNREMAELFLNSGEFLWNSGIFVWGVKTILQAFEEYLPSVSSLLKAGKEKYNIQDEREFIENQFPRCPNISIDYGIMEKSSNVYVLPVNFGWADLGTWGSLYELGEKDPKKNVSLKSKALFYEAKGNLVSIEDPQKLVVVQGINNCIISESNNVLLICSKEEEQRIKHFVADAGISFGKEYN